MNSSEQYVSLLLSSQLVGTQFSLQLHCQEPPFFYFFIIKLSSYQDNNIVAKLNKL